MKPFTFGSKTKTNFRDYHIHPKSKWINWWEDMNFLKSKKARRQQYKEEIFRELYG
jgi:hypothetical protein